MKPSCILPSAMDPAVLQSSPLSSSNQLLGPAAILAAALLCGALVLRADFNRRKWSFSPYLTLIVGALSALTGKALFLLFAQLHEFQEGPLRLLLVPAGASPQTAPARYAELLCALLALTLLARRAKILTLEFLDGCAPAAAAVAAIFSLGYLLPEQASRLQVRAVPEFLAAALVAAYLWWMGTKAVRGPKARGEIFCNYLILISLKRLVFQLIAAHGTGTQIRIIALLANVLIILAGAMLLWRVKRQFHGLKQEHRILDHIATRGDVLQTEYHRPTAECPHPERWHMYDSMSAEAEVLDFLKSLVTTIKPELVVETGTFTGLSTLRIAEGLRENGFGRVITCEYDPEVFAAAQKRFSASGLAEWIDARNTSSLELEVTGPIGLLFCDSDGAIREQEVRRFLPELSPHGLIVMHDASSAMKVVRDAALRLESEGLLSVLLLPTPRGLVLAQKHEGRPAP